MYSRLELDARRLLPRQDVRGVLLDRHRGTGSKQLEISDESICDSLRRPVHEIESVRYPTSFTNSVKIQ